MPDCLCWKSARIPYYLYWKNVRKPDNLHWKSVISLVFMSVFKEDICNFTPTKTR